MIERFQGIVEECLKRLSKGESTLQECLARYPEYNIQLTPLLETALLLSLGRETSPLPMFVEYTHNALLQYTRPRPNAIAMPMFQRTAFTFAMLAAVFLVTGTAQSQSALPGDAFYTWKRTSERAWRIVSPDPVATDIVLAERRLNEWIAVSNNSTLSTSARFNYLEALSQLKTTTDLESLPQVVPALQLQRQTLDNAGLAVYELDNYLIEAAAVLETDTSIQDVPTTDVSTAALTPIPTQTVLTQTDVPTGAVPTETEVPTEVIPTETETPTEVIPTETETPTEVVPTETEIPTEVVSTETEVPTGTEPPSEIAPTETEVPAESTPIAASFSTVEPTDVGKDP